MRVFISWSGSKAKRVASCLHKYLPCIIQAVEPWMSNEDIGPGQRALKEIGEKLEECSVGICVVTSDNFERPWLNFEMGALSKSLKAGKPMPLLFQLTPANLTGPVTQFQCFEATKEGMLRIVREINSLIEKPLDKQRLEHSFNTVWTEIDKEFKKIGKTSKEQNPNELNDSSKNIRKDREILEEILEIIRNIDKKNVASIGVLPHHFGRSPDESFVEGTAPSITRGVSPSSFALDNPAFSKIENEQETSDLKDTQKMMEKDDEISAAIDPLSEIPKTPASSKKKL